LKQFWRGGKSWKKRKIQGKDVKNFEWNQEESE